ncbi:MAG: AAA family ATPase [Christensenellales bacterium]|jgi:hypothetical protein
MTEQELKLVIEQKNAAIIAPAGHGKTEMITELVKCGTRRQLLLTHTNAGVDVLRKRLVKYQVPSTSYHISTIAAFCTGWCFAYPKVAGFDIRLSPSREQAKEYYSQLYAGAGLIFQQKWALRVLANTYEGIVVDEYQDCLIDQHKIFIAMNEILPVRVLGDPLQGIFGFAGTLVDWDNLGFQVVDIETRPWRWQKTNPELGEQLAILRENLLPILKGETCSVDLCRHSNVVTIVSPSVVDSNQYSLINEVRSFSSVAFITQWERSQISFCKSAPGVFQVDEKVDCNELFDFAAKFDAESNERLMLSIIEFGKKCATGVSSELSTIIKRVENGVIDFSRIKKHAKFCDLLRKANQSRAIIDICNALLWFEEQKEFKFYRKELYKEMIRSLKYAILHDCSVLEAASQIRKETSLYRSRFGYRYLSSRTLLSKGLEFDCVIIDMRQPLKARDFYVAMTRAMRKIYVITSSPVIQFSE